MQHDSRSDQHCRTSGVGGWLFLLVILLMVSGCFPATRLRFIVPDTYEGPLIIRYTCPGGEPVARHDGRVLITFRRNGTACLAESYQDIFPDSTFVVEQVQTASGSTSFPWITDATNAHGPGFLTMGYSENRNEFGVMEAAFSEYWVGNINSLRATTATATFVEQRAIVYEQLGASRNGDITLPKPAP